MTSGQASAVEYGSLTLGRRLGQGGQGSVHEVTNKKINKAAGDGWDVAYKEYSAAVLPELDAAALESQVALVGGLDAAKGRWLCEKTAWPAAVVHKSGSASGFLMRAVPDRFRFTFRSLSATSPGTSRLANLEFLLNDDAYVAGIGLRISERDRLLILADLAATLAELHRIGITVGDLSPKNLLFTTDPKPECFLIDCDAMRLNGATVLPQAETPDWQIPAGEEKATRASDVYKLSLLAVRLFARDQAATDPDVLRPLDPALADLARAGLSAPASRPTPATWAEMLTTASRSASAKPTTPGPARPARRGSSSSSRPTGAGRPASRTGTTGPTAQARPRHQTAGLVAAALAFLGVLVLIEANDNDGTGSAGHSSSTSTYTPSPTYDPDPTYDDDPTYDPTYDDDPTYDPEPTYEETDEETYEPDPVPTTREVEPPDEWGAIAVSSSGAMGWGYDYSTRSGAEQGALAECAGSCKVLTVFVNGCGAIAHNSSTGYYWGGSGSTRAKAQQNAINRAGGGRWIKSVCTS